ncbi:MAG: hypothetical protein V1709_11835 [Planctomycetota bacterium]
MRKENLRDALLQQEDCSKNIFNSYRKEVEKMLQEEEKQDQREKWLWGTLYGGLGVVTMMSLLMGAFLHKFSNVGLWQSILACVVLLFCTQLFGMGFYRQIKLHVFKESKQTQMLLAEIMERLPEKK